MRRSVVLLGMMARMPVAGVVWQTLHYLLGLRSLGFDAYYVEAHARTPSMLMRRDDDDSSTLAATFIDSTLRRFDLGGRWAFQALHDDGRCYGLSAGELSRLLDSAELIINLHGGTLPRPEHSRTGRLVYVETDPVQLQAELQADDADAIEFLEQHCAFFTFAENWGAPDCGLPRTARFDFRPTRQPVQLELWPWAHASGRAFTTVGNFRQQWRDVTLGGRTYTWSKHVEFERYLTLPAITGRDFELGLGGYEAGDVSRLSKHGWRVIDAAAISADLGRYRNYISGSLAEFTVAKEQNVALRSGWFSDRSATYLAAGRPVVTQDTGFSCSLPTGVGLHSFRNVAEAAAAVERVFSDYRRERLRALEIAREFFASEVVLGDLLEAVGVSSARTASRGSVLRDDLRLTAISRRPLQLAPETVERVRRSPVPHPERSDEVEPEASVVVVSYDHEVLTRLCVESVLENTDRPAFELVVVDNGSSDGSRAYLRTVERRFPNVRLILNKSNRGFPAACNQGLAAARGRLLALLNNDAIVPPGWLARLARQADRPGVGLVGPTTNRIGNEAELLAEYETYGQYLALARARADDFDGAVSPIRMPAMFCVAFRRDVLDTVGCLDEQFGVGLLEDDDYAERVSESNLRCLCCEDVFVHHFGEGTFGRLYADGAHGRLLAANRARFERKWGRPWVPYPRRPQAEYEDLRHRIREIVALRLPAGSAVAVANRGDEELVRFNGHRGLHFPQTDAGVYAGRYPVDGVEAIEELEAVRRRGADYFLLPRTSFWWLDHYAGLSRHLDGKYARVVDDAACIVFELGAAP